ncbi:multicopper oxidase family protein (plasmid) [Curtobacterium sp. C1]|uniref:multicopper oxidase family protein n=1 Tax=Curtobacterium sp. C1 TaxID=2898151 RepID=UPI001E49AF85|nr:multicopper oxidase family protein [Curtobacterium sp. C1]UFU15965.1 multicopper oxidase family protein [Curtobacterium sp. C1]
MTPRFRIAGTDDTDQTAKQPLARHLTRRAVLAGAATASGAAVLAACAQQSNNTLVLPTDPVIARTEQRRASDGRVRSYTLTAALTSIDLAGTTATTWAYGSNVPGPQLRVTAGDTIDVVLHNTLPSATSIHWHGLALRNDMDGVPPATQTAVPSGSSFRYRFKVDQPGTYWLHPHVGPQLDRGLYAPLIVDDPHEPMQYDDEWVIVLDDWLDGVTTTPDTVVKELQKSGMGGMGGMGGMSGMSGMGGMSGMSGMSGDSGSSAPTRKGNLLSGTNSDLLGGDTGDVYYPYYLINGHPKQDPQTFSTKPGKRIRLRIINAGGDTAFRLTVQNHPLTVTHTDGYPVKHQLTDAILLGMGERYDALVTVQDGAFAVIAEAVGKNDRAVAVLRSNPSARTPILSDAQPEGTRTLNALQLHAASDVNLDSKRVDRTVDLALTGGMSRYDWGFNGKQFSMSDPLKNAAVVRQGERVALRLRNKTMMWHPFHLHGHTFQLPNSGARKDTVILKPMQEIAALFDADNPGVWAAHCHNVYHQEAGMMTFVGYAK